MKIFLDFCQTTCKKRTKISSKVLASVAALSKITKQVTKSDTDFMKWSFFGYSNGRCSKDTAEENFKGSSGKHERALLKLQVLCRR